MEIMVQYEEGVFKPLQKIIGLNEGDKFEIHLERTDWHKLAMNNPSFLFLKEDSVEYGEKDIQTQ